MTPQEQANALPAEREAGGEQHGQDRQVLRLKMVRKK